MNQNQQTPEEIKALAEHLREAVEYLDRKDFPDQMIAEMRHLNAGQIRYLAGLLADKHDEADLCFGYTLEECRDLFAPEGVSDERIREVMDALIEDNDWIEHRANSARHEAMQEAFDSLLADE